LVRGDLVKANVVSWLLVVVGVGVGGCGGDSSGPEGVPTLPSGAVVSQRAEDVVVGELLPSQTARAQASAIRSLRRAGFTVETNGVEEAVLASLEDGEIGSAGGRHLAGLKTLEQIQLWNCPDADDALVERLAGLAKLRVLAIRGGRLTDGCFEQLSTATALESLNLGNTAALTGVGVAQLLSTGRIKRLYLDRTGLSDEVIAGWSVKNSLEMLNVNHTRLGLRAASRLREFRGLRSVFVVQAGISIEEVSKWRVARPDCLVYDGRERPQGASTKQPNKSPPSPTR
jgi:hypothetical protein